ncbi:amidohydrolase [soil metagenome]
MRLPSIRRASHRPFSAGAMVLAGIAVFVLGACQPEPSLGASEGSGGPADLILTGGVVWTGNEASPEAEAIALRGNRILAVGSVAEVNGHRGSNTRVIELEGRFVAPGFIDNHTHFNQAGALLLGVNLLDASDEETLLRRVSEAVQRMPSGSWITGGNWGAYEAWAQGSAGAGAEDPAEPGLFSPDRSALDEVTRDNPVLVNRWDRSAYLANAAALNAAGADCGWTGVECSDGVPTGRLEPDAARRILAVVPEKTPELRLAEAREGLVDLRRHGVTTIHDNTPPEMFGVFQTLFEADELTTRIYARPTLDRFEHQAALGLPRNFGNDFLMLGGFKGFVDGIMGASTAMFHEPFDHTGGFGIWRDMMDPPGNMERLLLEADRAGYWPQVHAIGDFAIDTLLALYERVEEVNGPRDDRRFRVIHAQHLRGPETAARMAALGVIAEVQPFHAIDDMRWMEERIGEDRIRWTYAFRTLDEAGVMLSFGSDWPGTQASWYTANPLMGIYAAVTRETPEGEPAGGWIPEERIDVETALRAYTVNNAWAEGTEDRKGQLQPGFLADIVVLDRDPRSIVPSDIQHVRVDLTVVDGRIVHEETTSAQRR